MLVQRRFRGHQRHSKDEVVFVCVLQDEVEDDATVVFGPEKVPLVPKTGTPKSDSEAKKQIQGTLDRADSPCPAPCRRECRG